MAECPKCVQDPCGPCPHIYPASPDPMIVLPTDMAPAKLGHLNNVIDRICCVATDLATLTATVEQIVAGDIHGINDCAGNPLTEVLGIVTLPPVEVDGVTITGTGCTGDPLVAVFNDTQIFDCNGGLVGIVTQAGGSFTLPTYASDGTSITGNGCDAPFEAVLKGIQNCAGDPLTPDVNGIIHLEDVFVDGTTIQGEGCQGGDPLQAKCYDFSLLGTVGAQTGFNGDCVVITPFAPTPGGLAEFAMFYGLTTGTGNGGPNDYAATVAAGAPVPFPRDGAALGGIVSTTDTSFTLPSIGVYEVTFKVHTTEPGELQLDLDGVVLPESTSANMNPTAGGHIITNTVLVTTTVINQVLRVINPAGNTPALTITPADGASTHAVSQTLIIKRIA